MPATLQCQRCLCCSALCMDQSSCLARSPTRRRSLKLKPPAMTPVKHTAQRAHSNAPLRHIVPPYLSPRTLGTQTDIKCQRMQLRRTLPVARTPEAMNGLFDGAAKYWLGVNRGRQDSRPACMPINNINSLRALPQDFSGSGYFPPICVLTGSGNQASN